AVFYTVFFFQAEDGIRDFHVTGVQTCALPIWISTVDMVGATLRMRLNRVCMAGLAPMMPMSCGPSVATGASRSVCSGRRLVSMKIGRASCRERVWGAAVGGCLSSKNRLSVRAQ